MIGARQAGSEGAAIADDATGADPAETDAMIAALAPDQSGARALPPRPLEGERDLERGIDRFGAAVREEDAVESIGHQRRNALRQFESQRMHELDGRSEIEDRGGIGEGLWGLDRKCVV